MDTFADLISDVKSDLNIGSNSSLYPDATIKKALNRAYFKTGALFKWSALQDSKTTTTVAGQSYYEAPTDWRPNSMWKLTVNGVRYGQSPDGSPLSFDDYLIYKEDNPNSTAKKWAVQWLRYFITPTPSVDDLEIVIWGYKNVDELVNDDDTTIFSYNMPDCNDAIVMEASAILKKKGENDKSSQFVSAEAKQILVLAYSSIKKDTAKYEKNQPFFSVPNYFNQAGSGWDYDPKDF